MDEEIPFEDRHIPQVAVEWSRSAWWWTPLTRAVQPAIKMTTLVLSFAALWIGKVGILMSAWLFEPSTKEGITWEATRLTNQDLLAPNLLDLSGGVASTSGILASPIVAWSEMVLTEFMSLQFDVKGLAFVSFMLMWFTLVGAMLGGVLARRTLVELGQRTIAPWGESIRLVFGRWQSLLWSTGMHLVGIVALLVPIVILGAISRLGNVGAIIGGSGLLLLFPMVFAVGRMMLSMVFGFPLSVCAIAAEKKADAFEGFSRSNAYLFQRPVVALFCALLLAGVGLFGEQFVRWTLIFGWGTIQYTFLFIGDASTDMSGYIGVGNWLAHELLLAYWFSFFWSASACVYLILRRSVDNTELHDLDSLIDPVAASLPEIPPPPASTEEAAQVESAEEKDANTGQASTSEGNNASEEAGPGGQPNN